MQRDIKITPIEANRIFNPAVDNINATEDTSTSVLLISISQLYEFVKSFDKHFFKMTLHCFNEVFFTPEVSLL